MTTDSPTRIFYDTEFLEHPDHPIRLISIGMVAMLPDGTQQEYYAVREEMPLSRMFQHSWIRENVMPHLPILSPEEVSRRKTNSEVRYSYYGPPVLDLDCPEVKPTYVIRNEVSSFLRSVSSNPDSRAGIELWADYAAYDHVVLAQLFGRMIDLPKHVPMFTHDIQQFATSLGMKHCGLPSAPPNGPAHHALNDAHKTRERWEFLHSIHDKRQKRYDDYEDSHRMLLALQDAGVDNWHGYDTAMEEYRNPEED